MMLLLLACHLPFHEFAALNLALPDGAQLSPADTARTLLALEVRGEPFGIREVKATAVGFAVEFPFETDLDAAGAALITTADLEFALVDEGASALLQHAGSAEDAQALAPGRRVVPGCPDGAAWLVVGEPALTAANVAEAKAQDDQMGGTQILLAFDEVGGQQLAEITTAVGSRLLIRLDGSCLSAPVIREPIRGGRAAISMGGASAEQDRLEAEALARTLNGALPVSLSIAGSYRVGKER